MLLPEVEIVAWCESTFYSHALNYSFHGLMQMADFWFVEAGLDPGQWGDPVVNLRAALHAYNENVRNGGDGWGPWTCKPCLGSPFSVMEVTRPIRFHFPCHDCRAALLRTRYQKGPEGADPRRDTNPS